MAMHTKTIGRSLGSLCLTALLAATTASMAQDFSMQQLRPRPNPSKMLKDARDLFFQGEYDGAAQLYKQVATFRESLSAVDRADLDIGIQQTTSAQQARQEGLKMLKQAEDFVAAGKANEADTYVRYAQAVQQLSSADRTRLKATEQAINNLRLQGDGDPATALSRARDALKHGNLDAAETLARQAEKSRSLMQSLVPFGDSPARVLEDVRTERARRPKSAAPVNPYATAEGRPGAKDFPPTTAFDNADPSRAVANYSPAPANDRALIKAQAKQIVMDGYKAIEMNNLEQAKALANQAKEMRAELEWWEPNPDKLLADIARRAASNEVVATSSDPTELLRQGRAFFLQQRFDDAEKLALKADSLGRRYGLFEDSPKKLKDDIARGRSQLSVEQAAKLTAEARRQFNQKNFNDARNLAMQAKQMHSQGSSFLNWADTPDAVLRDVARFEKSNPPMPAPYTAPPTDIAQTGMTESLESAHTKEQMKTRAVKLVAEARMLELQDHLVEARGKALEASKLTVAWGPAEDSPASVLRDLGTRAAGRVTSLVNEATEIVERFPADPTRFQKADTRLVVARQLAEAFGQDVRPIMQKAQWLQTASTQIRNDSVAAAPLQSVKRDASFAEQSEPTTPAAKLGHEDARKKLDQARLELKAGNTPIARRLAEDAFLVPSVQVEAQAVLRSIDAEEHDQVKVAAERNFQAGMDAYKQRDYPKAASILANLDVRNLKPEQARRVGEVIDSPEMRSGIKTVGGLAPPVVAGGQPSLSNLPTLPGAPPSLPGMPPALPGTPPAVPGVPPALVDAAPALPGASPALVGTPPAGLSTASDLDDPRLAQARTMQTLLLGKFRDSGRSAQSRAIELGKAGKEDQAIEILEDYKIKLKESGLEEHHIRNLSVPVDGRIKSLQTSMAQKEIERERKNQLGGNFNEAARVASQTKTQEKVVELIKKGNMRYKEGKYDEAIAEARRAKELDGDNTAADALINLSRLRIGEEAARTGRLNTEDYVLDSLNADPGKFFPTSKNALRANPDVVKYNIIHRKGDSVQHLSKLSARGAMIERKLSQPITLNFQDVPLYRVLQDLQVMSGINIATDDPALKAANVSLEQPLRLKVEDISLKSALNLLLRQVGLTYVIRDEVLYITTPSEAEGKRKLVTYSIADLIIPVDDHATDSVNSLNEALKRHISSTGGGVRYNPPVPFTGPGALQNGSVVSQSMQPGGGGGGASNWQSNKANGNTIEHVLRDVIENVIAPNTWERAGGEGRIQYFPLGHALVVSQVQEVQEEVYNLLTALRKMQDIQISIEMRIVSVSEKFFERIGLDFDINIKTPQYRVENQLATGQFGGPFNINRNLNVNNVVSGLTPAGQLTPDLNVPVKATSFEFSVPPFGGFPGTLAGDGGLALGLAFLSDIQVFMFLEAAQGDQRTHIMQAPKLTVFNGQTANISVQDQQFFITGVSIAQAGSQTFFVPQNQPFPTGVGMQVTPVVSADRRFVRLNLVPQITSLISANIPLIPVQIPIPQLFDAPNGQGFQAGQPVIFQMFFQQPGFTTINLQTTVNVPDGGTVLLGGLKTLAEGRNEFGPPILSKIPYLNRLFRNQAFGREAQSIMIMVTPRIIINEEIEGEILGNQPPIPRP